MDPSTSTATEGEPKRRDFLYLATGAAAAVGGAAAIWPFISQLAPDASTVALSTTQVDISPIARGAEIKVLWRGKPVFVRHRTDEEIKAAEAVSLSVLRDPQTDQSRVQKPEWLIVVGICTHLGCVPLGYDGEYKGWYCPCHGSVYDTSGRIRHGPAPLNLEVPAYTFVNDKTLRIG
jgi:ubiquinol-cytochrome c reductase iron-sulfur subunit